MRALTIVALLAQGLLSTCAPVELKALERDVDNWNAAAWSNFVKVYAVDDNEAASIKRDVDNWNAAAWSNFVKVYAVDDAGESTT